MDSEDVEDLAGATARRAWRPGGCLTVVFFCFVGVTVWVGLIAYVVWLWGMLT